MDRRSNRERERQRRKTNGYSGTNDVEVFLVSDRRRRAIAAAGQRWSDASAAGSARFQAVGVARELRVVIDAQETCNNPFDDRLKCHDFGVYGGRRRLPTRCCYASPPPHRAKIGSVPSASRRIRYRDVHRDTGYAIRIRYGFIPSRASALG